MSPSASAHVDVVAVTLGTPRERECLGVLDASERARAGRFVHPADAARYVAAHAALRLILAQTTGIAPAALQFTGNPGGKPSLVDHPNVEFNLTHAGDYALVAVCLGSAVGVDLERRSTDVDVPQLAQTAFSVNERAELEAMPVRQQLPGFFVGWVRKEAYLKGRGLGITRGLDHFDVSLDPDQPARLLADRRDPGATARWSLHDLPVWQDYRAAVAVESPQARVTRTTFDWQSPAGMHLATSSV